MHVEEKYDIMYAEQTMSTKCGFANEYILPRYPTSDCERKTTMLLIANAYLMNPADGTEKYCDILIKEDRIVKIGERLYEAISNGQFESVDLPVGAEDGSSDEALQIIDATGLIAAPGLVDVHSHFRDPGFTYKEDIETGAKAAAKGGYTTVVLMANTKPAVDNEETLAYVLNKGKETGIHVETCATVTMGMQGKEMVPMEQLFEKGAVGFTDDGVPILDLSLIHI